MRWITDNKNRIFAAMLCMITCIAHAASPIWTFAPLSATSLTLNSSSSATVSYLVTNQSRRSHTLALQNVAGITQNTSPGNCSNPFTLNYQQSCILTLNVDGADLQSSIHGGPVVCQQGSSLQCYQPSSADALDITYDVSTPPTTLTISVTVLALSVNDIGLNAALTGLPRTITISNSGMYPAVNVTYLLSPGLPSGTSISPSSCGTLASGDSCTITITPGSVASATPGDINPSPVILTVSGSNTNSVAANIHILTYGSVYQSGYLFSVDDSTSPVFSIGGKVVSLTDQSGGVIWSSNGNGGTSSDESLDIIPLIGETSSADTTYSNAQTEFNTDYANSSTYPFPSSGSFDNCQGGTDGNCNTNNILALYSIYRTNYGVGSAPYTISPGATPANNYAAGLCQQVIDGYSNWYLPAICELGYDIGGSSGCGNAVAPTIQNIQSNLTDNGDIGTIIGPHWSSTEDSSDPKVASWVEDFDGPSSLQVPALKDGLYAVRCVHELAP